MRIGEINVRPVVVVWVICRVEKLMPWNEELRILEWMHSWQLVQTRNISICVIEREQVGKEGSFF